MSHILTSIPVEIVREIFSYLRIHNNKSPCKINTPGQQRNKDSCMCWQLDLLSVSMVSKSWYSIAVEFMNYSQKNVMPWLPLLNYASHQRTFPFRSRLVKLLDESRLLNLVFHHTVSHLIIDLASFDTIRRERTKNNMVIKRKVHHGNSLADVIQLLKLCTNTEILEITCDAGFVSLLPQHGNDNNCVVSSLSAIEKQVVSNSKIKRLDLTGFNPVQRCPCCAGKNWDKYLSSFIGCLKLDTLVLQHVLPSKELFEALSEQKELKRIVLYRSLITIPESQTRIMNDSIQYNKRRNDEEQKQRKNSISRIPLKLWKQITSLSIYEDIEDASTWPSTRYLYDLVQHVGSQLQEFTLQFGTKEENESSLQLNNLNLPNTILISDPTSVLHELKIKCKESLQRVSLINVPEYQPIS
ncbi:hypothetical protein BDF21DRAFT_418844 [Thamnidium elegans]|nr:hypothetical protein BDF21DRAFT_418844 [Thamnidium elegans]